MPDDIQLSAFKPRAKLVTQQTTLKHPRFPLIDAHLHLSPPFGGNWYAQPVESVLEAMDAAHVTAVVDLDGGWGEAILDAHLRHFKEHAPERFVHFGGVDWSKWPKYGDRFGEWAASRFRAQVKRGAQGLKVWKNLGLHVQDQRGQRVTVDDERLDPLWASAGELNVPVTIHIADPVAFFDPLDARNERWEELQANPDCQFPSPPFPPFMAIMEAFARVVRRHPQTTFIGAHVGCYAENLGYVGNLLDTCPNFYVDISSRLGELGRQPYSARKFFLKYAERILFGTDARLTPETYALYARFLETDDEYFSHNLSDPPWQGRWYICGLFLPDEVLRAVYAGNAQRIIFDG